MEEEKKEATPTIWKALIMGNSYYNKEKSELNHLPVSKPNLDRVYDLCKNRLKIKESDISKLLNYTADSIKQQF